NWTLNLKDIDIRAFVEQVSSMTGENFVVDPQIKGKVTVIATTPMRADAVKELFLAVMRVNGYAAVPSGNITRIVPQANAKLGSASGNAQQIVTRVIPVKNSNIEETIKLLKPLISANGYLEGSVFSNTLIVSDYADNVQQITSMLSQLDKGNDSAVEVIALRE